MTTEIRLLLKVSVHAVKKHNSNLWLASFTGLGVQVEGTNPSNAICNYLEWVKKRLLSTDIENEIANDLGIGEEWIPAAREVFCSDD